MQVSKIFFIALVLLTGISCGSVSIQDYANNTPKISLPEFFEGSLSAHGIVKNRSGEVLRYFNAELTGTWNDQGVGTLYELFLFDDGEEQERTWVFTPNTDGTYIATAGDVVEAGLLETAGNAFFMSYVLRINYQGKPLDVTIDDRMYATDSHT